MRDNDVTGAMLLELCAHDAAGLEELGITSKLHVSKLRTSLKALPAPAGA